MKRLLDFIIAALALVIFSIPLLVLSILIRVKLGNPIFFSQMRPGQHGKPFKMIKFRTMTDECDSAGVLLSDSVRLTPFGRFLRSTSLDELPGLWSVLKGDMSLVGPRPLLMQYLPLYSPEQAKRHKVRPGITGWAQINGRNTLSWEEKFELDVWYVDNRSMLFDMKILWLTVRKVIVRDGINAQGDATMPAFIGKVHLQQTETLK